MISIKRFFQYHYAARSIKREGKKDKPFAIGLTTYESNLNTANEQKEEMIEFFDKKGLSGLYTIQMFIIKDIRNMLKPPLILPTPDIEYTGRWREGTDFCKWEPVERKEE